MNKMIFILLLLPIISNAQLKLLNKSLTTPDSNILYRSWDNELQFNKQIDFNKLKIIATNSTIKISNSTIICEPQNNKSDTIKVYRGKKLILKQVFAVKSICSHSTYFANSLGDTISIDNILKNPSLSIKLNDCFLRGYNLIIDTFTFVIIAKNQEAFFEKVVGKNLTKTILDKVKTLNNGDTIIVDDIKVTERPFGYTRKLPIILFKIK